MDRLSIIEVRAILKEKGMQNSAVLIDYHIRTNSKIKDIFDRADRIGRTRMIFTKDIPELIEILKEKQRMPKGHWTEEEIKERHRIVSLKSYHRNKKLKK